MSHKTKPHGNKPAPQPKQPSSEKESTTRHVYVEPGVKMDFVDDLKKQFKTAQDENTAHQNRNLFWTKIAAGVLLIYTLLTGWLGCLTKKSIDNNTRQFQTDQRPYVWNSNVINPINVKIVAGQKMWMNIHLLNFGKAPAFSTRGLTRIFIGDTAMQDADAWFGTFGEQVLPDDPAETGIVIPPGIPGGDITDKSAFGGGGYFTAMSDHVLRQEEVDYILHSNEKVVIVAHTQYFDSYGTRYWSNFCLTRFDSGAYPNCPKHNEMR